MNDSKVDFSPWPYLWAWILCLATFPLLWIGGLITTTDAGMAVPDWPGTYGYNMFLYPWQTWFYGPWDLFIEHGHRLFASGVGLITIIFMVVVWRNDQRAWLRWLSVVALLLVITQGALGGMRVVLNARMLAMVHGCTGPLFFALTSALVVLTSKRLRSESPWPGLRGLWLPLLIYAQITAGASLRHVPEGGSFNTFSNHVFMHLTLASAILIGIFYMAYLNCFTSRNRSAARRRLSFCLAGGVLLQISLGLATWFAKYYLPDTLNNSGSAYVAINHWATSLEPGTLSNSLAMAVSATEAASQSGGWSETHTITAHSAIGSLLLALATALAFLPRSTEQQTLNAAKPAS